MKRIVVMLLTLSLVISMTSIAVADVDLSEYSTEYLVQVKEALEKEIARRVNSYTPWSSIGLGAYLPELTLKSGEALKIGKISINSKSMFTQFIENATEEDYTNYVALLKLAGYTIDASYSFISFEAKNEEGYKVEVHNFTPSSMIVYLYPPK